MPPPDPEQVSVGVFTALADPNRRAIIASLAEHGPSTATDLAGRLRISRQGVAKHLLLLAENGLVSSDTGEGRRVLFRHRTEPIKVAQSYLAALAAEWDGALDRLSTFLAVSDQAASGGGAVSGGATGARPPASRTRRVG